MDFSGGITEIVNVSISEVNDKAISAGETAKVDVKDAMISNVGVGLASKDGSSVTSSGGKIYNASLSPLMVYQKKDFYAPGEMLVEKIKIENSPTSVAQFGGFLSVNGSIIQGKELNTKFLYENTVMKK